MLSVRLIEIKIDLEKTLDDMKESLQNIKMLSYKVDEQLMEVDKVLSEDKKFGVENAQPIPVKPKIEEKPVLETVKSNKTILSVLFGLLIVFA